MIRTVSLLAMVAVLVAAVPAAGLAAPGMAPDVANTDGQFEAQTTGNHTDVEVAPGERLAGVIGVQKAELEGEVERRTFGVEVARAASNESKAGVVKERLARIGERLAQLEERKHELRQARENGSMSEGEYRAGVAVLAARTETVKQLTNESEARANELPTPVLESAGVDVAAIETLKRSAGELGGPEVAEIARSIAGPGAGKTIARETAPGGAGPSGDTGAPGAGDGDGVGADRAGRTIDSAESQIEQARERIDRAEGQVEDGTEAADALADAKEELSAAEKALADAKQALETGDYETALELARQALDHARAAIGGAQQALEGAGTGTGQGGAERGADEAGSGTGSS